MRKPPPKKMAAPKITFVGGTKLTSTGLVKTDTGPSGPGVSSVTSAAGSAAQDVDMDEGKCITLVGFIGKVVTKQKFHRLCNEQNKNLHVCSGAL